MQTKLNKTAQNLHCFPIAPADDRMEGFPCGMLALASLFALPSLSAAEVVLEVMFVVFVVDCDCEVKPSCSERGFVDLGMKNQRLIGSYDSGVVITVSRWVRVYWVGGSYMHGRRWG